MSRIFIVCPECHQKLSFMEMPGYENKIVECPKCHFKAAVSVYRGGAFSRGAHGSDEVATQLVTPPPSTLTIGQFRVKSTGEVQWLKEGSTVIGRRAQTSTADIQISSDPYMSRRHVRIDVVKLPSGGYEHRLIEINSTNIVKLNGRPIQRGDILKLKFGDVLTLGKTDIIIESGDEDATRLM